MSNNDDPSRPTLNYATSNKRPRKLPLLLFSILGSAIILVLIAPLLLRREDMHHPTVQCASHLRQIGQAIQMYANENHGEYPDSFARLLMNENITAAAFVCPSSNDTEAPGPNKNAVATNLTAGGHLSYIYLAPGRNAATISADAVVAYEPLSNHAGAGMHALFGDGHVDWLSPAQAKPILTNAKSSPQ